MLLSKHHGLGNDFLVVLDERNERALAVDGDLAIRVCDRRRGIGADGLIHGAAPDDAQRADGVDVVMHLFNSDGSRAEMSGNGIRCLAQAVATSRNVDHATLQVSTDAGVRTLQVRPTTDLDTAQVTADMGAATGGPRVPDPVAEALNVRFGTVSMGNPHLVVLVDDPAAVDLSTEGAWLEQQFADGINVEYIASGHTRDRLDLRVWERGAGITQACGTGACAAAHEAHRWDLVDTHVRVSMPGGEAEIDLTGDGITLAGPVSFVGDIFLSDRTEA